MKRNSTFDIRKKISFSFFLSGIILAAIIAVSASTIKETRIRTNYFMDNLMEIKSLTQNLEIEMLSARRNEKDFFARKELKYKNKVIELSENMLKTIEALKQLQPVQQHQILDNMKKAVNSYKGEFIKTADLYNESGVTEDTGLRGKFRKAASEMEKDMQSDLMKDSLITYLYLRRAEKDYLSRSQKEDFTEWNAYAAELENLISLSPNSEIILKHFSTYKESFLNLTDNNKKIENSVELLRAAVHSLEPALEKKLKDVEKTLPVQREELNENLNSRIQFAVVVTAIALILLFVLAFIITRSISKPMKSIIKEVGYISEGNFSTRPASERKDEFGIISRQVHTAAASLKSLIINIQQSTDSSVRLSETISASSTESSAAITEINANIASIISQVNNLVNNSQLTKESSEKILKSIEDLNKLLENQSAYIVQSTASVEELIATIKNITAIAESRRESAAVLIDVTESGGGKIISTNRLIGEMNNMTNNILDISNVINDIASRTNLLAMNAAIEAAHAGEAGRGFAVVSDEIRKLAESTASHAGKISATIKKISSSMQEASESSQASMESFDRIKDEVENFLNTLGEISTSMLQMSAGTEEVLSASEHLSSSVHEVSEHTRFIISSTKDIDNYITINNELSDSTLSGMTEVNTAIEEIQNSVNLLQDYSLENESNTSKLKTDLKKFSV